MHASITLCASTDPSAGHAITVSRRNPSAIAAKRTCFISVVGYAGIARPRQRRVCSRGLGLRATRRRRRTWRWRSLRWRRCLNRGCPNRGCWQRSKVNEQRGLKHGHNQFTEARTGPCVLQDIVQAGAPTQNGTEGGLLQGYKAGGPTRGFRRNRHTCERRTF